MLRTLLQFIPPLIASVLLFSNAVYAATLTPEEVIVGAERMYRKHIAEIDRRQLLDLDAAFLARVFRVAQPLLQKSQQEYPNTRFWKWEIHITNDVNETAYCMAGGKILISQTQVRDLNLNDIELAMLISHEIQHALQEHNFKEYLEAMRLFPEWKNKTFAELEDAIDNDETLMRALAPFNLTQETEADLEGMRLAWRTGLSANRLIIFFKKLARASASPNFDSKSHPAPTRRWQSARALALTLEE